MWEEILRTALSNGLWAVLFCLLLMYQLRDGRTREGKYRDMIDTLLQRLETLDTVAKDVGETLTIVRKREKPRIDTTANTTAKRMRTEEKVDCV